TDTAAQLRTVDPRHHPVDDRQRCTRALTQQIPGRTTIVRDNRFDLPLAQCLGEDRRRDTIVIGNQCAHGILSVSALLTRRSASRKSVASMASRRHAASLAFSRPSAPTRSIVAAALTSPSAERLLAAPFNVCASIRTLSAS